MAEGAPPNTVEEVRVGEVAEVPPNAGEEAVPGALKENVGLGC